ncbi:hypothetical protein MPER_08861 [Moniliophthora perniciosa FA553]|nr:hypothetical protein MPER_08861 [Moniliophthora perniciosa FA553]
MASMSAPQHTPQPTLDTTASNNASASATLQPTQEQPSQPTQDTTASNITSAPVTLQPNPEQLSQTKESTDTPTPDASKAKKQTKSRTRAEGPKRKGAPTKFNNEQLRVLESLRDNDYLPLFPDNKSMNKWLKEKKAEILNEAAFAGKLLITAEETEAVWQKRIEKFFTNTRDNKKKEAAGPSATAGHARYFPPPPATSRSTMRFGTAFKILKKAEIDGEVDEDNTFESVADALWADEVEKEQYEEAALGMQDLAENQHQFLMATLDTLNACAQYGHIGKAVMQLF